MSTTMSPPQNGTTLPQGLITIGYNLGTEQAYLLGLDIGTWLAIGTHLLFYHLVISYTPKEMFNYRITVSNTSTWCLSFLVFFGVLLRPVPLFPLPVAKLTGPLRFLGEYWGGQIGWQLGFLCIANFLTAAMICFSVLAVFLLEPKGLIGSITKKQGIFLAITGHLGSTIASLIFLNFVYRPTVDLKAKLLAQYPEEIGEILLADNSTIFFGYDPSADCQFMAPFILILFGTQGIFCTSLYGLLLRSIWSSINKGSKEQTARSRRNVVAMLTARMTFPTIFGFLPVMLICAGIWFRVDNAFGWYCAFSAFAITHGFQNTCATIGAYKPYRDGMMKGLLKMASKVGILSDKNSSTFFTLRTGGGKKTASSFPTIGGGGGGEGTKGTFGQQQKGQNTTRNRSQSKATISIIKPLATITS